MKTETWLPILTLGLGWGLAQVTEMLKDRRVRDRERLTQRAELQRTTLLELQEHFAELWRGVLWKVGVEAALLKEDEQEQSPLVEASHGPAGARGRVKLLASRVEDERVRELSVALASASRDISAEDAWHPETATSLRDFEADYSVAVARAGELLRERY